MDERDKRYRMLDKSRNRAIEAALASMTRMADMTALALKEYKVGANEWRDTVKDLVAKMPTRAELIMYAFLVVAVAELLIHYYQKTPLP